MAGGTDVAVSKLIPDEQAVGVGDFSRISNGATAGGRTGMSSMSCGSSEAEDCAWMTGAGDDEGLLELLATNEAEDWLIESDEPTLAKETVVFGGEVCL